MGRNAGIFMAFGSNFRVSSQPSYTPGFVRQDGVTINQRIKIPCAMNGLKNQKTNKVDTDFFQFVAWGKLADFCAKTLNKGRAFDAVAVPHTYQSRYFQNNVPVIGQNGQPLLIDRVAFTITQFRIGEEARELIDEEIRAGKRPQYWDVKNHPDNVLWMQQIILPRNAIVFTPGMVEFGYAKVFLPNIQQPVMNNNLPNMVHQAFNQPPLAPIPQPMTGANLFGNGGFNRPVVNNGGTPPVYNAGGPVYNAAGAGRPF